MIFLRCALDFRRGYEFQGLFSEYDLLVTPGANTPAFDVNLRHPERIDGVPLEHYMGASLLTSAVTLSALPALSLPCGFDQYGRAVGLQIVGKPGNEGLIARIGNAYEERTSTRDFRPIA